MDLRSRRNKPWGTVAGIFHAEAFLQDVHFAGRTLRKSWGFTLTAILTLALGIGANTAIFQLFDAVRLRKLPVPNAAMLASVRIKSGSAGFGVVQEEGTLTYRLFEQIKRDQRVFSEVFTWARSGAASIGERAQERRARGLWASGDTFTALGLQPYRGRFFGTEDDRPGCGAPGVVISYALWQSEFGGSDSAIGSKLTVSERLTEVIGVTPPDFFGLEVGKTFDYVLPFCSLMTYFPTAESLRRADLFWVYVAGRLKPGVSERQAALDLEAISPGVMEATLPGGYNAGALSIYRRFRLTAIPAATGISSLRQMYDTSLWLLLGITGLVLLIACANLANLMLARASTREREMAVRLALGASPWRLIRQLLSEGLLLAVAGAALGMGLAAFFSRSLVRFLSTEGDAIHLDLSLDWRILVFTAAVSSSTCLIFGLAPAFRSSRAQPGTVLKTGSRGTTPGQERFSFQRLLVVTQIAVSVVLMVGALLFVRSFWNLTRVDPGFRESGILMAELQFLRMPMSPEGTTEFIRRLLAETRGIPGVESAATSTHVPLNGSSWSLGVHVDIAEGSSRFVWVSPGYFRTMEIPLVAGRDFAEGDARGAPRVAIVNETFAKRYSAGVNPIGRVIRTTPEPGYPEARYEIVGVVRDTKYNDLREPAPPIAFSPADQFPDPSTWCVIFVRYSGPAPQTIAALREKYALLSPNIQMDFHVLRADVESGLVRERMMALLSGFFGAVAALLAMIGLYGLISYIVSMRKNEFGIRLALGASGSDVIGIIVRQTAMILAVGVAAGLVLSLAAARGASALLFGLAPDDPLTLFGVSAFLAIIALTASYIPAYRASRVDPMNALRYE
jgi:predicted permease